MVPPFVSTFMFVIGCGAWVLFWAFWFIEKFNYDDMAAKALDAKREYCKYLYLNKLRQYGVSYDQLIFDHMNILIDQGKMDKEIEIFLETQMLKRYREEKK